MNFVRKHERLFIVLFLVLTLCMIGPIVIGSGYTYLAEDDFSFEAGANDKVLIHNSQIVGPLIRAYEFYFSNQGTYVFNVLIHILRIYTRWGLPGFHLFMILLNIGFAFSLFYFIRAIFNDKLISMGMMLAASSAVYLNAGGNVREIYFWYTGAMNYTLGLFFSFIGIGLCLNFMNQPAGEKKMRTLILSMIVTFIGSGTALEVTAPNCAWLLAIIILCFEKFKADKRIILPFISAFAGAILNVVAPGNFPKTYSDMTEGHSTAFDALVDTASCFKNETLGMLKSPVLMVILMCTFLACILLGVKILSTKMTGKLLVISIIGSFLVQFFTIYPVCFGYHKDYLASQRTAATYELVAKLMYIFIMCCLAQWVQENGLKYSKIVAAAVVIACAIFSVATGNLKEDIKSGYSYMVFNDLRDGSMQGAYKTREYVLAALSIADEGSDAYINVPLRYGPAAPYGMGLTDNPEEFVNISAAGLYHLNSVSVNYY